MFEALFIINPNVTVEFLSFDIMMTDELVGESTINGDFLINGTTPPLVVQPSYQLMYLLTISTGNMLDTSDTTDVTFNLFAFVNISTGVVAMPMSNVILHKIGKVLPFIYVVTIYNVLYCQIIANYIILYLLWKIIHKTIILYTY